MKITDDSLKPSRAYHKINTFVVSENEGNTKEGPGKSMKNALYAQRHGKRHLSGWSNVEQWKIKSVNLAVVELRKSEGISQSGS